MRGSFSWKVQFLRTNYIFNYADESTCTCFKTAISVFVERRTTNINLSYFSLTLINESCCSKYNCSLKFSLLHILQVCLISFFNPWTFFIFTLSPSFFLRTIHFTFLSNLCMALVLSGMDPLQSAAIFSFRRDFRHYIHKFLTPLYFYKKTYYWVTGRLLCVFNIGKFGNLSVKQPVYWHFDLNVCGQFISSTKERENA